MFWHPIFHAVRLFTAQVNDAFDGFHLDASACKFEAAEAKFVRARIIPAATMDVYPKSFVVSMNKLAGAATEFGSCNRKTRQSVQRCAGRPQRRAEPVRWGQIQA